MEETNPAGVVETGQAPDFGGEAVPAQGATGAKAGDPVAEAAASAISQIVAHYRAVVRDGPISLSALTRLFTDAVATTIRALREIGASDPVRIRALAVAAAGDLFDAVAPVISIPYVPTFVETNVVNPALRAMVLALASGLASGLIAIVPGGPVAKEFGPAPITVTVGGEAKSIRPY